MHWKLFQREGSVCFTIVGDEVRLQRGLWGGGVREVPEGVQNEEGSLCWKMTSWFTHNFKFKLLSTCTLYCYLVTKCVLAVFIAFSTSTDVALLVRDDNLHEAAILILYEVIYLNSNEKLEEYHEIGKGGLWGELSCINLRSELAGANPAGKRTHKSLLQKLEF